MLKMSKKKELVCHILTIPDRFSWASLAAYLAISRCSSSLALSKLKHEIDLTNG